MIVKKCPAYYENLGCMSNKMFYTECKKEDNCTMKQLIRKINNEDILKLLEVED